MLVGISLPNLYSLLWIHHCQTCTVYILHYNRHYLTCSPSPYIFNYLTYTYYPIHIPLVSPLPSLYILLYIPKFKYIYMYRLPTATYNFVRQAFHVLNASLLRYNLLDC